MFQYRQPINRLVPTLMPDAKLVHAFFSIVQQNLSIDPQGLLATVRSDRCSLLVAGGLSNIGNEPVICQLGTQENGGFSQ